MNTFDPQMDLVLQKEFIHLNPLIPRKNTTLAVNKRKIMHQIKIFRKIDSKNKSILLLQFGFRYQIFAD